MLRKGKLIRKTLAITLLGTAVLLVLFNFDYSRPDDPTSNQNEFSNFSSSMPLAATSSLKKWRRYCFGSVIEKFHSGDKPVAKRELTSSLSASQVTFLERIPKSLNVRGKNSLCHHDAEIEIFFEPSDKILTVQWSIFDSRSKNKVDEFSAQVFN